ncbi:helix-turn-helix transcriptional regulator [Sporosarcina sp. FSL K6-3457]|uniref:helix-turn-helix transcriptional regulator n=1 Tax=Sporosarcina sp. FSL K6-3457 TaxID=2978204 RepID=UPI0030F4E4B8
MHSLQVRSSNNSYLFRKKILRKLKTTLPYEAFCFTTVDPHTLLSTGAITDERIELLHPELFENEYIEQDINRYSCLLNEKTYCNTLYEGTKGELSSSKRFHKILSPAKFHDELRAVLVHKERCYGFLTLFRTQEQGFFSLEDIAYMKRSIPSIAKGLKDSIYQSYQTSKMIHAASVETGIIILNQDFEIISTNQTGIHLVEWLRQQENIENHQLPRPIRAICSQVTSSFSTNNSKVIVHAFNQLFMSITASPLLTSSSQIALLIERIRPREMNRLLVELFDLTKREHELVEELLKGNSTKMIADKLYISSYTVQDHLKSIFNKTGVNSRRELIGKINTFYNELHVEY